MSDERKTYQLIVDADEYFLSLTKAEVIAIKAEITRFNVKYGPLTIGLYDVDVVDLPAGDLVTALRNAMTEANGYDACAKVRTVLDGAA